MGATEWEIKTKLEVWCPKIKHSIIFLSLPHKAGYFRKAIGLRHNISAAVAEVTAVVRGVKPITNFVLIPRFGLQMAKELSITKIFLNN